MCILLTNRQITGSSSGLGTVIDKILLTASGNIDFIDIPTTFDKLEIEILRMRSTGAGETDFAQIYLNGDFTDANYRSEVTRTGGTTAAGVPEDITNLNDIPFLLQCSASASLTDDFTSGLITISRYADDKKKTIKATAEYRAGVNQIAHIVSTINWENTDSIIRVTIRADNDPTDEFEPDTEAILIGYNY